MSSQPLVIVLLGPTASGKTALSLDIAERFDLPVHNVDSRQLYREMDVGTAKPTPDQQARVAHHLLDLRNPDQPITLQEFQAEAEPSINRQLQSRGIALLVGGSGLYLKALTSGLRPPAVAPQPALRQQFAALGIHFIENQRNQRVNVTTCALNNRESLLSGKPRSGVTHSVYVQTSKF